MRRLVAAFIRSAFLERKAATSRRSPNVVTNVIAVREAEEQIKNLVDQCLLAARNRDKGVLDRLLHDDFIIAGWQPDGRLADKKFYIADVMTPVDIQSGSYKCDRWKFRFFGDIAIVNYVLDIHAVVNGQEWGGTVLVTAVWKKTTENDSWRLLSQHTSSIK